MSEHDLATLLGGNALFSGGLLLMLAGWAIAMARSLPAQLARRLAEQWIVTLDITSDDVCYAWIKLWLAAHPYAKRARRVNVSGIVAQDATADDPDMPHLAKPAVCLTPAPGSHFFTYRRRPVWLTRTRRLAEAMTNGAWTEDVQIRILGRSTSVLDGLIAEARALAESDAEPRVSVRLGKGGGYWQHVIDQIPRHIDSVLLDDGVAEALTADVRTFLDSRAWYVGLGIPYRRGYLFHGTPGSGKSSTIMAIASHFALPLCVVSLSAKEMDDQALMTLMTRLPSPAAVMLEDVDAIFVARRASDEGGTRVTFSGLLNALDGAIASEGRLLFMTTNHLDRLDAALIRPGRVDYRVRFDTASPRQAARLYARFFPEAPAPWAATFGARACGCRVTMAWLQEFLLTRRDAFGAMESVVAAADADVLSHRPCPDLTILPGGREG